MVVDLPQNLISPRVALNANTHEKLILSKRFCRNDSYIYESSTFNKETSHLWELCKSQL